MLDMMRELLENSRASSSFRSGLLDRAVPVWLSGCAAESDGQDEEGKARSVTPPSPPPISTPPPHPVPRAPSGNSLPIHC